MRRLLGNLLNPKYLKGIFLSVFCFYGLLHAQTPTYPNHPVTLVLPYATGGTVDIQARLLASGLTQKLGQPFIVRNMPGATGAIATDFVVHAVPDGYTLLFASSAQTTSVPLTEKVNYKLEDLAPVSASGRGTMILAINAQVPAKNLTEFIAYGKANQGKISYGSSGTGSVGHLVGALFGARAGLEIVHIPYKGGGPVMSDLLGGQIPMLFGNSAEVMGSSKNPRLRILAVSSKERMKQLPDIPTVSEFLPNFEMTAWQGTLAPVKTPKVIIDLVSNAIQELSKDPKVIEALGGYGVDALTTTPEQMAAMIKGELSIYTEAVKAAGLTKPNN
jgi:tripartite-type tricarboxylate transporter receptor subunit TctC